MSWRLPCVISVGSHDVMQTVGGFHWKPRDVCRFFCSRDNKECLVNVSLSLSSSFGLQLCYSACSVIIIFISMFHELHIRWNSRV